MATTGDEKLVWLTGDGRGGFGSARELILPGTVTAMSVGEINRGDGPPDVVVGVAQTVSLRPLEPDRSRETPAQVDNSSAQTNSLRYSLMLFEGPDGALRHDQPQTIAMRAPVTSIAIGPLNENYEMDLVAAAGDELVIMHGHDRKPTWDDQAKVQTARVEQHSMPFTITSVAIGDFSGDYRNEVALLSSDGTVHVFK